MFNTKSSTDPVVTTFCNGLEAASSQATLDWGAFDKWVDQLYASRTAVNLKLYGRRFFYVLSDPSKASDLHGLTPHVRNHAMRALAALSKFLGCYEVWKRIKSEVGLKWANPGKEQLMMLP
ncbi:MAG: hypothetical protein HA494_04420 [Thaumarchaeota archaeon]|nr:hypothetical protein [Nitrososphaerota archaeon]